MAFGRGAPIPTFPGRRRPGAQVRGWRHGCRGCRHEGFTAQQRSAPDLSPRRRRLRREPRLDQPLVAGRSIRHARQQRLDGQPVRLRLQARIGPVTATPITRQVAGKQNKGVSQRFVVSMLGQNLPHEARFFKAALDGTTAIIMTQVADEDAKAAEPGFAMALDTLRYHAGKR